MISKAISPSINSPTTIATGIIQSRLLSSLSPLDVHPNSTKINAQLLWLLGGTNLRHSQYELAEENSWRQQQHKMCKNSCYR